MNPFLFLGCTLALVTLAESAVAVSPVEVQRIARAATVEIKLQQNRSVGSGVIIARQGVGGSSYLYTLVTNRHVVCGKGLCRTLPPGESYSLSLSDQQQYRVDRAAIRLLGENLDLAIVQFRSNKNYEVAVVAPLDSLKANDVLYTSGFPLKQPGFSFNAGKAFAVVNKRLTGDKGGYNIVYNAETLPGMSGGGVFNEAGQLIAIHGFGDRYQSNTLGVTPARLNTKIGLNRGIPIRYLVQNLQDLGIRLAPALPTSQSVPIESITADEYFIAGFNKFVDPGDDVSAGQRQAIQDLTSALQLNPQYVTAYYTRAILYSYREEFQLAISDFDRAIITDPKYTLAYTNRGILKVEKLGDYLGARADFDQAIALDPKASDAYGGRGVTKYELNDLVGAMADFNQAIALDPRSVVAHNNRGALKSKLNDAAGAMMDLNQAILMDATNARGYYNRGVLKSDSNDFRGAIADFDRAIAINPKYAEPYRGRGAAKSKLKDLSGALADFDRAIALEPKQSKAYRERGYTKAQWNDFNGAIADYNQAILLDPKDAEVYNNRGNAKDRLNDVSGALADFERAIAIDAKLAVAYYNRGRIKQKLNDFSGALADFDRAIAQDPAVPIFYNDRGVLKYQNLNNPQGALADYNRAVLLQSNAGQIPDASVYHNRGTLKFENLNDPQGALADYDRAIAIDSKLAVTYAVRGILKFNRLNDRPGGIQDLRQSIKLFRAQGQKQPMEWAIGVLQKMGVAE
jgi:tetratricopeptide (TPR) repeat protein